MDGVEDIDNGNFFLNALITVLPFSRETENSGLCLFPRKQKQKQYTEIKNQREERTQAQRRI